jgi:mono/diheme cytochrome c family protein
MKNFFAGFLLGTIFLTLGALGYLRLGLADVRADAPMPGWAARLFSTGIHASVRRAAPNVQSPLPQTDATLIAGAKLYLVDCSGCHGEPGKPPSEFGATFNPPAPQFPRVGTQYSQAQAFYVAKHGVRRSGMCGQADSYKDPQIWALVAFITQLPNLPPAVVTAIQQKPANL